MNELLSRKIADRMERSYARLSGRGTTALYIAFRALANLNGVGEVIVPDLICSTALDAVLLAGFTPVFADVVASRWTIDPADVQQKINPRTRAILVAHLFGHVADVHPGDFSVPIVEDAIQGLGGKVGKLGQITVIGFADAKMVGGRGGVTLTDDLELWNAIQDVSVDRPVFDLPRATSQLSDYAPQLLTAAPHLIYPFDESAANVERIESGWQTLLENVQARNTTAQQFYSALSGLPLLLPELRTGDAIWRFTFAAPTPTLATRIARQLQMTGLPGSRLYPSLSALFSSDECEEQNWIHTRPRSAEFSPRLINLWVEPPISATLLETTVKIIRRVMATGG